MLAAQEAFLFAVTGGHNESSAQLAASTWYLEYLYARIREAWVPLFREVLQDINLSLYSPVESDLDLSMRFLTSVVVQMKTSEHLTMTDVVQELYNQGITRVTSDEPSHAYQLVFAAFGWLSMHTAINAIFRAPMSTNDS